MKKQLLKFGVFIRSIDERTEQLCKQSVKNEIADSNIVIFI